MLDIKAFKMKAQTSQSVLFSNIIIENYVLIRVLSFLKYYNKKLPTLIFKEDLSNIFQKLDVEKLLRNNLLKKIKYDASKKQIVFQF